MASLANSVARWLGRVELVARGADEDRRDALCALADGDALRARDRALALLEKAPASPIGLALLVDACESAWLDDEARDALRRLCDAAPWRGELWIRLGNMLARLDAMPEEVVAAFQMALEPDMPTDVRRQALLGLADVDLATGDTVRAGRWLDALRIFPIDPGVALRRLELGLAFGDREAVVRALDELGEPGTLDGRATLARARGMELTGNPRALDLLLRAYVLSARGADEALASYLSSCRDVVVVARIRDVLSADGRDHEAGFALALALAEGRTEDAQRALTTIVRGGDRTAARSLYEIALERKDVEALATSVEMLGDEAPRDGCCLLAAHHEIEDGRELAAPDGDTDNDGVGDVCDWCTSSNPTRQITSSSKSHVPLSRLPAGR